MDRKFIKNVLLVRKSFDCFLQRGKEMKTSMEGEVGENARQRVGSTGRSNLL